MKIMNVVFVAALVVATAGITSSVVSQDTKTPPAGQQPQMPPEVMEMWAKCQEAGTPGENHKLLNNRVGKWNGAIKMWMMPDMPADESTCTTEVKWILDGHYLAESVEGNFGGETFLGKSIQGYDNVGKKFFWVWLDNMCTGKMDAEGTFDPATKTFTYTTAMNCPMTGKMTKGRTVERWVNDDTIKMEMFGPWYKTGKEYKTMEITYTRAK